MRFGRFLIAMNLGALVCPAAEPMHTSLLTAAERSYRDGDFVGARDMFGRAVETQPASARALVGLAIAEQASFLPALAVEHLAQAFQLAPDDPSVVREYAAATPDLRLESALLHRLTRLASTPRVWTEEARARLLLLDLLDGRTVHHLSSAYTSHRLKLSVARDRSGNPIGWLLPIRINGSRPLRLLLDTGSRGLLLSRSMSASLKLETLAPTVFGGFGEDGPGRGKFALAANVGVSGLFWKNVMVEVMDRPLFLDLDGLAGADLFRQFRITLDGPGNVLELTPFEDGTPAEGAGHRPWRQWSPAARKAESTLNRIGHLLLAPVVTEEGGRANFAIDSGAAYSIVHQREPEISIRTVALEGLSGLTRAPELLRSPRIEIGGHQTVLRHAVTADLSAIGDAFGVRIDGFAGFPLLSRLVTTIDLRAGTLAMSRPGGR
jgi:Aspartyl protease